MKYQNTVVAIDGPSASGKSTTARRVAEALGLSCVDSGALYRCVTWSALSRGLDTTDHGLMAELVSGLPIEFFADGSAIRFRIGDLVPDSELRTKEVNSHVSEVAAVPLVRSRVVQWLRELTDFGGLVMEGRDIGTVVFPESCHKFYLDAAAGERARRRCSEMQSARMTTDSTEVAESIERRDSIDSTRQTDPLRPAQDATIIDSTAMGLDEVVGLIVDAVTAGRGEEGRE